MPEIGEVARVVHFIREQLVGKTIASVTAPDDTSVFGKVGTSGPEIEKALTGKKIIGAGQQGKYFWMIMESAPHPVLHFGMTGWLHIKGIPTYYYKEEKKESEKWPPRFWKFHLETKATASSPAVHAAFVDSRRFARVRLVDCIGEEIRNTTPLKENGPDPVIDSEILTKDWLEKLIKRKHVPIKALLLDQANISGIGNWVGDEILFNARLHPEQYSDTFNADQLSALHSAIIKVCSIAVSNLADSSQFPENWLFNYRWGKGKKDSPMTLPSGEKLAFLTVGGRTSCIVPSLQKKTGVVAGDVAVGDSGDEDDDGEGAKKENKTKNKTPKKEKGAGKRKLVKDDDEDQDQDVDENEEEEEKPKKKQRKAKGKSKVEDEEEQTQGVPETKEPGKELKTKAKKQKSIPAPPAEEEVEEQTPKTNKSNNTAGAKKQKKTDSGAKDTETIIAPTGNRKSRRAALKAENTSL